MRPAGARRREGAADVRGPPTSTATVRLQVSENTILKHIEFGMGNACVRHASTPFPYPVAAASAFEGTVVGVPWQDSEDSGVGRVSVPEGGHGFGLAMLSRPHGKDYALQPSVRKRASQVPRGRAAVRGCGTDRVGPPDSTPAQPAVVRRGAEQGNALLIP